MDILFCKAPSFLHVGWLPALWRDSSKVNAAVELASSRRLWSPSLILPGQVGKRISYLPSMYLPERPNNSSVILAWKGSFEFYFKLNKRLRNHESGDNIEQLQRQIPRQVPSKHRIWKRGKHSQSVGFCLVWHTRLPGEWHHRRLPDRNDHLGVRHLLPLPPSLPAHNHPHHLRSLQG